jgi:hypothetical protein
VIVAGSEAAEILEAAEHALDDVASPIGGFVVAMDMLALLDHLTRLAAKTPRCIIRKIARSSAIRTTHKTAAITIAWIAILQTLTATLYEKLAQQRIAPAQWRQAT